MLLLNRIKKCIPIIIVVIPLLFSIKLNPTEADFKTKENSKAVALDPFNSEFNSISLGVYEMYMRSIIYNLEQAGYTVDYYKDENVTINLLKKLDDEGYRVVYINSHGFVDSRGYFILFINEKIDSEKMNLYQDDIREGRIGYLEVGSLAGYLYVTPHFFLFYGKDYLFSGALIFIDACYSGNNTSLADVFLSLGAQCFIGWNGPVNVIHGIMMDGKFFHEARRYNKTVEQALWGTRADPDSGAALTYFGNGSLRILRTTPISEEDGTLIDVTLKIVIASAILASTIYVFRRIFLSKKYRR